ncbi:type IX secretion system protein PorQ [Saccharicrinis sp. FJH54]|uniref:type IX secretion system protein PorQ n=1 Tax=Saccharicrinis sp. FJH54 TaxID=3344665 RepID=UPI0035D42A4F
MRFLLIALFTLFGLSGWAQKGENTYEFLNLPGSAHTGALGGTNVSLQDVDPSMALGNPALLRDTMHNNLAVNYVNYIADINFGYATYSRDYNALGTFALGVQYINQGNFDGYDELGNFTGNFVAQETALSLIWSYPISSKWNGGLAFKQVFSAFEQYSSYGILFDAGISYLNNNFSAGLVLKNFGTQVKTYTEDNFEPMPFEIQMGFTQKLNHAPLRFSVTANHIQMPDLTYKSGLDKYSNPLLDDQNKTPTFGAKALRHVVFGVEFVPSKNLYVAAGYNFQRRIELGIENSMSTVGFSWGFGVKISKFRISYASARYHLAGTSNHISIATNLSSF